MGSRYAPLWLVMRKARAVAPSSRSVTAAQTKTASACPAFPARMARIITGTRTSRAIVKKFGTQRGISVECNAAGCAFRSSLRPPLPHASGAPPVGERGVKRRPQIEQSDSGQQRRPPRRAPVVAQGGKINHAHQSPGRDAGRQTGECRGRRHEEGKRHPGRDSGQPPSRIPQFREGSPRDHAPDLTEGFVFPNTFRVRSKPEPDAPAAALDGARQRAVIDEFAPDPFHLTDGFQRFSANQHAAARGSRSGGAGWKSRTADTTKRKK